MNDNESPLERLERAIRSSAGESVWDNNDALKSEREPGFLETQEDDENGSTGSISGTLSDLKSKRRLSSGNKLSDGNFVAPELGKVDMKNGGSSQNGKLEPTLGQIKHKFHSAEVVGNHDRKKGCLHCIIL